MENEDPKVIFYSGNYYEVVKSIRCARGIREFISLDKGFRRIASPMTISWRWSRADCPSLSCTRRCPDAYSHRRNHRTSQGSDADLSIPFYNAVSEILTLQLGDADSAYVWLPFFHTAA